VVYVDYATQRRIIKASGRFLGTAARRNGNSHRDEDK
jgi:hypothetical protein